jgi:hypothetical protein
MKTRIRPALLLGITVLGVVSCSRRNNAGGADPAKADAAPGAARQVAASTGPGPSQAVRRYLELVDKGDVDGALGLRTKDQRTPPDSKVSRGELASGKLDAWMQVYTLAGVLQDVGGIKSIEILNEKTDGDSAQVDARLSYRKAMDERI